MIVRSRYWKISPLLLTILMLAGCSENNKQVPTESGAIIIPDGHFNEEAWDESLTFELAPEGKLHILQSEEEVLLGIQYKKALGKYADVLLSNDSMGTINLHASMQLGERLLVGNWNDTIPAWNWGNNTGWIANTVYYREHNEKLLLMESIAPYEGFEFRISKKKIRQNKLLLRLEIHDFMDTSKNEFYPVLSNRKDTSSWLEVLFD